jgi:hypothetical protein
MKANGSLECSLGQRARGGRDGVGEGARAEQQLERGLVVAAPGAEGSP